MPDGIDEAQLRREIEAQVRAEMEAEVRAEAEEKQRQAALNAALNRTVQSATREDSYGLRNPVSGPRPQQDAAAAIIGAALAGQMIAGLPGTDMHEDGFGDGT